MSQEWHEIYNIESLEDYQVFQDFSGIVHHAQRYQDSFNILLMEDLGNPAIHCGIIAIELFLKALSSKPNLIAKDLTGSFNKKYSNIYRKFIDDEKNLGFEVHEQSEHGHALVKLHNKLKKNIIKRLDLEFNKDKQLYGVLNDKSFSFCEALKYIDNNKIFLLSRYPYDYQLSKHEADMTIVVYLIKAILKSLDSTSKADFLKQK